MEPIGMRSAQVPDAEEPRIATAEEVLATVTGIMRGEVPENEAPRLADRFRAAELLARYHGLLQTGSAKDAGAEGRRRAAEALEAAMAEMTRAEGEAFA
ncbi:MAG: hypothetical protein IKP10_05410 [Clostridia bacterium]|nr:hypothetical protein [Clostridia bacterium]